MKNYYQFSAEEVKQDINGKQEPLTAAEVKAHQEKFGPNELVEGKKKTTLQIFLEQYKDFLVIILIAAAIVSGFFRRCGECHCYPDRNHDQCDSWYGTDREGRAVAGQSEKALRTGGKSIA